LTPGCPSTAKRSATLQTGETCSTTNTTRAARGSTNFKVVMRRRFGPLVEIQLRVERKGDEAPAEVEDDPVEPPPPALEPATEETDGGVGAAAPPAEGACTGLGAAGTGFASVEVVGSGTTADVVVDTGNVGSGSGRVGTVVMVGRGGTGTGSASAYPANRPEPASAIAAAATLTPR
jgi:hypothetical protein